MTDESQASTPKPHLKLSEELSLLSIAFKERPVAMGELIGISHGRGQLLMLIFLSIPFISPLPLPGISTPLGIIMALLGIRIALAQKPWLPQKLMKWQLPSKFFPLIIRAAEKIFRGLEVLLKPRFEYLDGSFMKFFSGLSICVSGLLLMLPLPIPFTNGFPAWTVLLIAAGMIERDGLFILAGQFVFLLTVAYFVLLAWAGTYATDYIFHWLMFWKDYGATPME